MSLGANRDYKTRARDAQRRLAVHYARMKELEAEGMDRLAASGQAYRELTSGKLADRMKEWMRLNVK